MRTCSAKQNNAKAEQRNFARNEVCELLCKMIFFCVNVAQRKQKVLLSFAKIALSFANGNPSRLYTWQTRLVSKTEYIKTVNFQSGVFNLQKLTKSFIAKSLIFKSCSRVHMFKFFESNLNCKNAQKNIQLSIYFYKKKIIFQRNLFYDI